MSLCAFSAVAVTRAPTVHGVNMCGFGRDAVTTVALVRATVKTTSKTKVSSAAARNHGAWKCATTVTAGTATASPAPIAVPSQPYQYTTCRTTASNDIGSLNSISISAPEETAAPIYDESRHAHHRRRHQYCSLCVTRPSCETRSYTFPFVHTYMYIYIYVYMYGSHAMILIFIIYIYYQPCAAS